jgi:plastocyanin
MKKAVAIVVIIVIAIVAWLAFGSSNKTNNTTGSSSSQNSQPVSTNTVSIQNFAFTPGSISIKKGTTVTWTNKDATGHTVTESDGQTGPVSQLLSNGQTYSFTFSQAGTFHYHCTIHTYMNGTVIVTQ